MDFLEQNMNQKSIPGDMPVYLRWSPRALNMLIRVIGSEIVAPDLKYLTLTGGEDVLIGQYVLTRPFEGTKLEMRLFELYPSVLMNWTASQINDYSVYTLRSLHLGGSEGRCRPNTKCAYTNTCCGCDEKSFVTLTPSYITVTDGSASCPQVNTQSLPLCQAKDGWMAARTMDCLCYEAILSSLRF